MKKEDCKYTPLGTSPFGRYWVDRAYHEKGITFIRFQVYTGFSQPIIRRIVRSHGSNVTIEQIVAFAEMCSTNTDDFKRHLQRAFELVPEYQMSLRRLRYAENRRVQNDEQKSNDTQSTTKNSN